MPHPSVFVKHNVHEADRGEMEGALRPQAKGAKKAAKKSGTKPRPRLRMRA